MPIQLAIWVIIGACVAVVLWRLAASWNEYRGNRLITCPENQRPAGVKVDAVHAAATSLGRHPELRLSTCTRWPEKAGCGQECLRQVAASPADCLVRNILAKWFEGKSCATCGRPIEGIFEVGSQPALHLADNSSVEWTQVPVDQLMETLTKARPLCFACHMANMLVHEHPELVLDRSRPIPSRSHR